MNGRIDSRATRLLLSIATHLAVMVCIFDLRCQEITEDLTTADEPPPAEVTEPEDTSSGDGGVTAAAGSTTSGGITVWIGGFERRNGTNLCHVYADGRLVATFEPHTQSNPVFLYYHNDHLGSSSVMASRSGIAIDQYRNFAYGDQRYRSGTPAYAVSHRFTGQIFDEEVGLYYFNARYYDPKLGRFIQPDTIVPDASDSEALNRYSYARNNPLRYTDPTGHAYADWSSSGGNSGWGSPLYWAGGTLGAGIGRDWLGLGFQAGFGISSRPLTALDFAFVGGGGGLDFVLGFGNGVAAWGYESLMGFDNALNGLAGGIQSLWDPVGGFMTGLPASTTRSSFHRAFGSGSSAFQGGWVAGHAAAPVAADVALVGVTGGLGAGMRGGTALARGGVFGVRAEFAAKGVASEASSALQGARLNEHLRQLEKYGSQGFKELENGRFRYYGDLKPATTPGEMSGARLVREWNPETGAKRTWLETLDQSGTVRSVRPETGGPKVHYIFDANGNYIGTR